MPMCYIDNQYMDECIIDSKTGKLRHCSACEAVIQDLRDDYEALDERKRKYGEGPTLDESFSAADEYWEACAVYQSELNEFNREHYHNDE